MQAGRGTWRVVRRAVLTVVGFTVVLAGIIMLVTPGPGLVALAAGIGILAIEYPIVRRWSRAARVRGKRRWRQWRQRRTRTFASEGSGPA